MKGSQSRVAGSMKNKVVATELAQERERCDFDQDELFHWIYADKKQREIMAHA